MATAKKLPPKRRKKNVVSKSKLEPAAIRDAVPPASVTELAEQVAADGGAVIGSYPDPYGGLWLLLVALPIDKVEPTPFQRDASDAHVRKLGAVISKVGRFLDPLVATRNEDGTYWTPNGSHRWHAMKELGARTITALLVPEPDVATKILALNTEKAHNLKERALEVIRMARSMADADRRKEKDCELEFEEAPLLTLGLCYEQNGRFSGGAYNPLLRRTDAFLDQPLSRSLEERERRAAKVMALDAEVTRIVGELKERGMVSAYLRPFVVARVNPIRFSKAEKAAPFDATWDKALALAEKFDVGKVKPTDLARAGGPPDAE